MQPEQVRTAADARAIIEERGLSHVKVGVFDNDGGCAASTWTARSPSARSTRASLLRYVLGWDSNDQLYDNVKYTGWHTAYPDAPVRVPPASCRARRPKATRSSSSASSPAAERVHARCCGGAGAGGSSARRQRGRRVRVLMFRETPERARRAIAACKR
jgi:hypothetical protein